MIAPSRARMSAKASLGRCCPKNTFDRFALAASCEIQSRNAASRSREGAALQMRHPDQAIMAYSVVHTAGKTASGGVMPGLSRLRYQESWFPALLYREAYHATPAVSNPNPASARRDLDLRGCMGF